MAEITNLILAIATLLGSLGALVIGVRNSRKLDDVHIDIDGRMTELLRASGAEQKALGKEEGRAQNGKPN